MRWWFCIPGALVPTEVAQHAARSLPAELLRALNRCTVTAGPSFDGSPAPHLDWLWHGFGGSGVPVIAPYLTADADDSRGGGRVWCCDPVHFALARDHMLVQDLEATEQTRDDVAALMTVAAAVVRDAEANLFAHRGRWFLHTAAAWQLDTTPLDAALARSLTDGWPEGPDAYRWRKLLNDIQIEWHRHPINQGRAERGELEINGLWLSGGGSPQTLGAPRFASIVCDDPRLHAWGRAAGLAPDRMLHSSALPSFSLPPSGGDSLTLIDTLLPGFNAQDWGRWLQAWQALAAQWPEQQQRAAAAGFEMSLQLFGAAQSRALRFSPRDRWRFWRGADRASVAALLTDTP
jgi:hypothetical protein